MAALDKVSDYIAEARTLLQDKTTPYRYTDGELASALGLAVLEGRRLRPDIFLDYLDNLPTIIATTPLATKVQIDAQYRVAFVYYMVGHMHLRNEEEAEEARAGSYKNRFIAQLLSMAA